VSTRTKLPGGLDQIGRAGRRYRASPQFSRNANLKNTQFLRMYCLVIRVIYSKNTCPLSLFQLLFFPLNFKKISFLSTSLSIPVFACPFTPAWFLLRGVRPSSRYGPFGFWRPKREGEERGGKKVEKKIVEKKNPSDSAYLRVEQTNVLAWLIKELDIFEIHGFFCVTLFFSVFWFWGRRNVMFSPPMFLVSRGRGERQKVIVSWFGQNGWSK